MHRLLAISALCLLVGCYDPDAGRLGEDKLGPQAADGSEQAGDPVELANKHLKNGVALVEERNYDQALQEFSAAIQLDPTPAAYSDRGLVHLRMGDKEAGMADLNKAVEMDETDPISLYNRSVGFAETGELKKALADLDAAISFDPSYAGAFADRAVVHRGLGKLKAALTDYRRAVELRPNEFIAHNDLAWMLATSPDDEIRNAEQALVHARRAHELSGKRWETADTLGAALAAVGNFKEAVSVQQKAIEDAPAERREELRERLRSYQEGMAWREEP